MLQRPASRLQVANGQGDSAFSALDMLRTVAEEMPDMQEEMAGIIAGVDMLNHVYYIAQQRYHARCWLPAARGLGHRF